MAPERFIRVFIPGIIAVYLCTCKPTDIILHGEIKGKVTDATTESIISNAAIRLIVSNDSTTTDPKGNYLLQNLIPGSYEIQATHSGYVTGKKSTSVVSSETRTENFSLVETPESNISETVLDFKLDSTKLPFSISNSRTGQFSYFLTASQPWTHFKPSNGKITNDTANIVVTVDKTGFLSDRIYLDTIRVTLIGDQGVLPTKFIHVYVNGVMDRDTNYYKVIKIGNQTWMAENLRVGNLLPTSAPQSNNAIIDYYSTSTENYNTYGGFYQWSEMMQYMPPDNKPIGTNKGICPVGWHVPTLEEWNTLITKLGGGAVAGGKMKEKGITHWESPNEGATNSSGFSGLPGGFFGDYIDFDGFYMYRHEHQLTYWWASSSSSTQPCCAYAPGLNYNDSLIYIYYPDMNSALSVRCVKNQDNH